MTETSDELTLMGPTKPYMFQMRADDEFLRQIDELRRAHPSLPSRAELLRQLVETAFREIERKRTKSGKS